MSKHNPLIEMIVIGLLLIVPLATFNMTLEWKIRNLRLAQSSSAGRIDCIKTCSIGGGEIKSFMLDVSRNRSICSCKPVAQ